VVAGLVKPRVEAFEIGAELGIHEEVSLACPRAAGQDVSDFRQLGGGAVLGELEGLVERADRELGVLVLDDA
jgi:hypothetical protein